MKRTPIAGAASALFLAATLVLGGCGGDPASISSPSSPSSPSSSSQPSPDSSVSSTAAPSSDNTSEPTSAVTSSIIAVSYTHLARRRYQYVFYTERSLGPNG